MDVISFKIPKKDKEFLDWYSEKFATPVGSLYRSITLDKFKTWKLEKLLEMYKLGEIGFKEMCDRGDISLNKGMLILEKEKIDPPISELIDDYTVEKTLENIKNRDTSIFKNEEINRS